MLRNITIFVVALAVSLGVFLWAENQIAPSFQSCISQNASQQSAESANDSSYNIVVLIKAQSICSLRLIDRHNGFFAALSTLIIAIFTAVLGSFTISLARSTRQAANSATDSSNALLATERGVAVEIIRSIYADGAYWAIQYDKSPTMTAGEKDIKFVLWLKNYGKTTVTIYDIDLDIIISPNVPPIRADSD
jgi:hypothetical protein